MQINLPHCLGNGNISHLIGFIVMRAYARENYAKTVSRIISLK